MFSLIGSFFLTAVIWGKVPSDILHKDMEKMVAELNSKQGWQTFSKKFPQHFEKIDGIAPGPKIGVEKVTISIGDEKYDVGVGINSIYINAKPEKVVALLNDPKNFRALYDLDKDAALGPVEKDGTFEARIFKLVPGIETQDYTLKYTSHTEDKTWIQKASLVKDEKNFAIRENIKIVEPYENGSIYREVSLFYPHRWWVRMFDGLVKKVTYRELNRIGRALKCISEKTNNGEPFTPDLGKKCHKAIE